MRRGSGLIRAAVVGGALVVASLPARAFDNDLQLYKLGSPDNLSVGDHQIPKDPFAQERFARFVSDFALALAPMPSGLAASLGSAGFAASFTSDLAFIHPTEIFSDGQSKEVWPTEKAAGSTLFLPTIHLRKGLPFGLEVGTDFTYVTFSAMVAATGTLKWALLEGFLYVPEVSVKAFATTVLGTGALNLVIGGWDAGASERLPLWGGAELGLYAGYQRIGLNAETNNIDFDPTREDPTNPTSDDSVFQQLAFGPVLNPTTAFTRLYFGAEVRTGLLVVGVDGAYASGTNRIYSLAAGSAVPADDPTIATDLFKLALRLGVQF